MKRPWLTTSLISVIAVIGVAGVRHEAHMEVIRGLSSFRAALPPGTTFTYSSATPAILSLGATLTDITLREGTTTFRATRMRLGHPRPTPDGGISIRTVEVREPFLQTPGQIIHGTSLSLRQLILPPSLPAPSQASSSGSAPHSRIDLGHVALAHGQINQLSIQNLTASSSPGPVNIHSIFASNIVVDNYGPALVTSVHMAGGTLAYERTVKSHVPFPGQLPGPQIISGQASLERGDLRQKDLAAQVAAMWEGQRMPSQTLPPESLSLHNFRLNMPSGTARLDDLRGTGNLDKQIATLTLDLKGLHFRSDRKLPFPVNGTASTAHYTQVTDLGVHTSHTTTTLTIPDFAAMKLDLVISRPSALGSPSTPQEVLQATTLKSATFSIQGDRFIDTGFTLSARQSGRGTTAEQIRARTAQALQAVLSVNPALTAIPDYVTRPANRTLTLTYVPVNPTPLTVLNDIGASPPSLMALVASPDLKASVQ
ncbi:hypothetical protein [Gluconobacter kanchanaburiensis]|uniref:Uncharacterized protein n=1 Tax=Gluconobacter kanchanaburiensis NBRC 103587 TaxID=1307948 RepID=A0A511B9M2_9PROT|nr:hypothetical protein [Gluconobacter kanchanaburiensis]MBF0862843.1 hypothetical protein [Gluconobacter kanchanaburiensis]GBR70468.1 hypothetical protein AA103587_1886 [Gluconobacter kanchanaburiensis NBRC 103587]GEK97126.1 hypothetical protein GKA01_23230 [Gluconobacter kanchanaburiensis NBRC 103587]